MAEPKAGSTRPRTGGRPTSVEAAELTERLRRAAFDTFLEHGYDATTMESVAQAADITKGTLYSRYADKRELFIAVTKWALTRHERAERVAEPLPDGLAEALTVIARAILARSVDPDLVRLSRMSIAVAGRFPEFAASSQAVTWTPRIKVLIDLLRRHERAGTIAVPDVELAAEQFFAQVGAMPAWLAAYGTQRSPEDEERHIRHAVGLFLRGALVRGDAGEEAPAEEGAERREAAGATGAGAGADGGGRPTGASTRGAVDPVGRGGGGARDSRTASIDTGTVTSDGTDTDGGGGITTDSVTTADPARTAARTTAAGPRSGTPLVPQYRRLGHSGLRVSRIALDTANFGVPHAGCDERTATRTVLRYLDAGGNLIDTSGAHPVAEEISGRALRARRADVVLAATVSPPAAGSRDTANSRRHIRAACEASLRRLGTDHIDLYQLRVDDPATPLEETIDALDELVRAGKVLYVGAADLPAYRLMKALAVSDRLGRARFISCRGAYHLGAREAEREHFPLLAEEGVGFIGHRASAAGAAPVGATGRGGPAAVHRIAAQLGCTPGQLDLAWQCTRPVTSVLVEARTTAELDARLAAAHLDIPAEALAELDALV